MQEELMDDLGATHDRFVPLAIRLLKGVIYEEETRFWAELVKVQELPLRRYFAQIGL